MKPAEILALLQQVRAAVLDREDADCTGDPPTMRPNRWMSLGTTLNDALDDLEDLVERER